MLGRRENTDRVGTERARGQHHRAFAVASDHWHGLRLPAPMDGTQLVQRLVQPGDSFDYRFELPDAGTFWYHSHANETVQIERGLYGALIVLGPDEPAFDADRLLVLDDVKLDRHGNIAKTALFDRHSGREGRCS